MHKRERGFTLIEVIVVIAVLAILATITAIGTLKHLENGRDAQRQAASTTIAEALEKYYEKNGEYPAAPAITSGTTSSIASFLAVDQSAITKISAPSELALVSPSNPEAAQLDTITYNASSTVNNAQCQNDAASGCDRYTLSHQTESGETITIKSRRDGGVYGNIAIAPPKPSLLVNSGGGNAITAESSQAPCEQNSTTLTPKYSFQSQLSGGPWSNWSSWQTSNVYNTTGNQGSLYAFQTRTRCDDQSTAGAISETSDSVAFTVPINSPPAPSISLAVSGNTLTATANATTCAAGTTAQYGLRVRTNNGAWGAYTAWSTTRTASISIAQGSRYGYQAQARCYSAVTTSGTSTSTEAIYTHPISAPATPTVTAGASSATTTPMTGSIASCPAGTTAQYQYRYGWDTPYTSAWVGPLASQVIISQGTSSQGYLYTFEVQARCVSSYTTGPWSGTGSASYLRPMSTPGAPTGFTSTFTSDRKKLTWSWTAPACGPGTQYRAIHKWHWNEGNPALEWHPSPGAEGFWTPSMDFTITQNGTSVAFGPGVKMRASAVYRCLNTVTNRYSAWGPEGSSGTFVSP